MKLSLVAIALVFLSAGLPQAEKQRIVYAKYIEPPYYPPLPVRPRRLAACVTSEDGKFCFRHLRPGKYELRTSSKPGVNVTHVYVVVDKKAGQTKDLIARMSLGT